MPIQDYGTGISCISDWPLTFVFVSGNQKLGQDIAHRLQTIRGSMQWDLDAGWDMRSLFRGSFSPAELAAAQSAIGAECEKDERVQSATCLLTFIPSASTLIASITITGGSGPFLLVLSVDALTVAILKVVSQ